LCACIIGSCVTQRKITLINQENLKAGINIVREQEYLPEIDLDVPVRDTLKVKDSDGNEVLIMKAVREDDTGEMVAVDVLDAAVVTARFRNVAERHGKVDICFQLTIPQALQDSRWQLRMYPEMRILEDTLGLDPVIITGMGYRKAQLRGYQQYERFISRIVTDSSVFVNKGQLEIFLKRNLPELYRFRNDSSYVSDETFYSCFGVTEEQAVDHYTAHLAKSLNNRRIARTGKMFDRFVKAPIISEGLRLDTVIRNTDGDFVYSYIQTVNARPNLKKLDIVLRGEIWEQDKNLYHIPGSDPLTFYISSVSSFADSREKYLTRVIQRRAQANTSCYVAFRQGSADIDETIGNNGAEIGRIKENLAGLVQNEVFDLDSIVVSSYASPEGSFQANFRLSEMRSSSIARYFSAYISALQDSLGFEKGFSVDESGHVLSYERTEIALSGTAKGENWAMLDLLVSRDTLIDNREKDEYERIRQEFGDKDVSEKKLQDLSCYKYLREIVYPRLRIVSLDFYLHRKGMVKDTVHTTQLDTVYMSGVRAIRDRDYQKAVSLLRPYRDFNTAIAYTALDYNASALDILESLERTAQVNYLLAIIYSRTGDEQNAVSCYLESCRQEPGYVHRGNLDPEISVLKKRYVLE